MTDFSLTLPDENAHKSQNGRVLIVGGSALFHAASLWSANVAAHLVDMVFYASTSENNELIKIAKNGFRDGIVLERMQIMEYAAQADVILIGPGMTRGERQQARLGEILHEQVECEVEPVCPDKYSLTPEEWQDDTYLITNYLLSRFKDKKFVLDAGALQMVEPYLLTGRCLLTPHQLESEGLLGRADSEAGKIGLGAATILKKGQVDEVWREGAKLAEIRGGNAGLTKGGSGDVLAGIAAGLYCYNSAPTAAYWASKSVKAAAEILSQTRGPFFTTTQLSETIPATLWQLIHA